MHQQKNLTSQVLYKIIFLIPVCIGISFDFYLFFSQHGLPIDDAYIYVKYINNLAAGNGYSFNPGEISFGTTSFLFTIIGAAIHKTFPFVSAILSCQLLGILSHGILLWLVQDIVAKQTKNLPLALLAGAVLALSRPLYFTGPSGLETMLFNMMVVLIVWLGLKKIHPLYLGLAAGFLFLARPEGLYFSIGFIGCMLLYPFVFKRHIIAQSLKFTFFYISYYLFSLVIIILPYLLFVKYHSGQWMPMTYYGKLLNRNLITTVEWYQRIYQGFLALIEGYHQLMAQETFGFLLALLWMLSILSLIIYLFQSARSVPSPRIFATRMAFYLFFLFPFIYGAVYRVGPLFGGFFVRYIQIIIILFHIEGFIAFHHILRTFALPQFSQSVNQYICRIPVFLLYPLVIYAAFAMISQINEDRYIYEGNVMVNENVRRKAAEWINQNTEPDARIFTSNTGLGAIGAYANRTIKDEAGLINKDIYPFLAAYQRNENHWHNMLEYMKVMNLNYVTTFPPYGKEERFLVPVHTVEEPILDDARFGKNHKILIRKIVFPEQYHLAQEFEQYGFLIDRAPSPKSEALATVVQWDEKPALAIKAKETALDVRYKLMFPEDPVFTSALGINLPDNSNLADLKIQFTVFANYEGQRFDVFQKIYQPEKTGKFVLDEIEVDLQAFSQKYGFMLFGVKMVSENPPNVWAYFINPQLRNSNITP